MKIRDFIAFPFIFIGFLFVYFGVYIGGYFTAEQILKIATNLNDKLSGLQPKRK